MDKLFIVVLQCLSDERICAYNVFFTKFAKMINKHFYTSQIWQHQCVTYVTIIRVSSIWEIHG